MDNNRLLEMENRDQFIKYGTRIVFFSRTMSSTSKKHDDFVSAPMRNKEGTMIPGIGSAIAENRKKKGITSAYQVFGQFLVLRKNKEALCNCLIKFAANNGQRNDCYNAMLEWSQNFLE